MSNAQLPNGSKAVAVVITLLALIGGLAAIVRPMQKQLDYMREDTKLLRGELKAHADLDNHPWGVVAEIAELRQQFAEVETQFGNLDERTHRIETSGKEDLRLLDEKLQQEIADVEKVTDWLREYHVNTK